MSSPAIWDWRCLAVATEIWNLACVSILYLIGELLLWGLSRTLASLHLEFFASILGMTVVFLLMTASHFSITRTEPFYRKWLKSKVDFINSHLGVGFPVPMVMLNPAEILGGKDIARVIACFLTTNLLSWTIVFVLSFAALAGTKNTTSRISRTLRPPLCPIYKGPPPIDTNTLHLTRTGLDSVEYSSDNGTGTGSSKSFGDYENGQISRCSRHFPAENASQARQSKFKKIMDSYPIILSLFGLFTIGVPVAVLSKEERVLDGFALWCVWISSVKVQRAFKSSDVFIGRPKLKTCLATVMNPVVLTTLLMAAYTRAKAAAQHKDLTRILRIFSGGSPLYELWTSLVTGRRLSGNPDGWFGAGDAALSLLECGILIWGFKLYECRRQLFSIAGFVTVIVCVASAAGSVFLSVLAGRAMGLGPREALSFAARSATLALAKPAVETIGGNVVVTATLVVSNGILGQLMCPFVLDRMGVKRDHDGQPRESAPYPLQHRPVQQQGVDSNDEAYAEDDPVTVAAGIAVGVNAAAMGVAYLYETKSRAAPYAALSMTVCGVMTVIFTTVQPFQDILVGLASS